MTTRPLTFPVNDREFYPLHEEDDVPEIPFHRAQTTYLYDALRTRFPERFVSGNICIYWEPGNTSLYRAPDVFVAAGQPVEPEPRVYHTWQDPPVVFAAEIGLRSTFREDEGPKLDIYSQNIQAQEYLYSDPPRGDLRLWRLEPEGYMQVPREENGRLRSAELALEFGLEDGWLWIYTPDGERLRTHVEAERDRAEAEARAAAEALRRQEAEERAIMERARREEMERRLAELEAELKRREGS